MWTIFSILQKLIRYLTSPKDVQSSALPAHVRLPIGFDYGATVGERSMQCEGEIMPDTITRPVRIHRQTYQLIFGMTEDMEDNEGILGTITEDKLTVHIRPGSLPQQNIQTLWHEIFHGILYSSSSVSGEFHSEPMLNMLENAILEFFQDNLYFAYPTPGEPGIINIHRVPFAVVRVPDSIPWVNIVTCEIWLPRDATNPRRIYQILTQMFFLAHAYTARIPKKIIHKQVDVISHEMMNIVEDNPWIVDATLQGELIDWNHAPVSTITIPVSENDSSDGESAKQPDADVTLSNALRSRLLWT